MECYGELSFRLELGWLQVKDEQSNAWETSVHARTTPSARPTTTIAAKGAVGLPLETICASANVAEK